MAFPGGAYEVTDADLQATALREAAEEAGIDPTDVEVLGVLDDLPTSTSGWLIRPFVALLPDAYPFVPDGREVVRVLIAPLDELAAVYRSEVWDHEHLAVTMHFYELGSELVWGVTARMLHALLELARD